MGKEIGVEDPEQWLEDCPERVYEGWKAAYRLRPFGDEQELLARILCVLILIAKKDLDIATIMQVSSSMMRSILTSEWVGSNEDKSVKEVDAIRSFEDAVAKRFG